MHTQVHITYIILHPNEKRSDKRKTKQKDKNRCERKDYKIKKILIILGITEMMQCCITNE